LYSVQCASFQVGHRFRLPQGGGQRLLTKHVLGPFESRLRHRKVERIGRANVHRFDFGIRQQLAIIARRVRDVVRLGELSRLLRCPPGNRGDFYVSQAAQRLHMNPPHETSTKHGDFD